MFIYYAINNGNDLVVVNCFISLTAHAPVSTSRRMSNRSLPKSAQTPKPHRDKDSPPATSSVVDEQSDNVNDLAEFWREYKRRYIH